MKKKLNYRRIFRLSTPVIVAVAIFTTQILLLSNNHGIFVLLTVVVAAFCAIIASIKLRYKSAFIIFATSVLYILLSSPLAFALRSHLTDYVNTARFFNRYQKYEEEITASPRSSYREWIIGNQDATQYSIIHDTTLKFKETIYNDINCTSHYFSPAKDYYIVTRRCE
jgi:cell division protein FtsW (lipid II flippase)